MHRHHLAHLQVVHPDDIPRFARLSATANIQPLWATHEPQMDELTIPFLGERRSAWQYPFRALQAAGTALCAGSDWPVSSPNPLWGAHVAVNRSLPARVTALRPPVRTPSQITCLGPPCTPPARTRLSSTAKPAFANRFTKAASGPCDHTASTPPGESAARAADNPRIE